MDRFSVEAVNEILTEDITKLSHTFIPPGFRSDVRGLRLMQNSLANIIDCLGKQSTEKQGLNKIITTAEKLRNSPHQIMYILKDSKANGGKGEVIGYLRVGRKHLFLYDANNKMYEADPLCILDFFMVEHRQRHGFGKMLFDYMLRDWNTVPRELAIDGPSYRMENFMRSHYGIERLVKHSNNFATSHDFIKLASNIKMVSVNEARIHEVVRHGRYVAQVPPNKIGEIVHGEPSQPVPGNSPSQSTTPELDVEALEMAQEVELKPKAAPEPELAHEPDSAPECRKSPERPSTLSVEPVADSTVPIISPAGSTISRSDSQLTERGFFDVKFYHNKLW